MALNLCFLNSTVHRNFNCGTLRSCLRRLRPRLTHSMHLFCLPVTLSASTFVEPTHSSQSPSRHLSFRLQERHRSCSPLGRPVASLHHSPPLLRETVVCLSLPAPLRRQSPRVDLSVSSHTSHRGANGTSHCLPSLQTTPERLPSTLLPSSLPRAWQPSLQLRSCLPASWHVLSTALLRRQSCLGCKSSRADELSPVRP